MYVAVLWRHFPFSLDVGPRPDPRSPKKHGEAPSAQNHQNRTTSSPLGTVAEKGKRTVTVRERERKRARERERERKSNFKYFFILSNYQNCSNNLNFV